MQVLMQEQAILTTFFLRPSLFSQSIIILALALTLFLRFYTLCVVLSYSHNNYNYKK